MEGVSRMVRATHRLSIDLLTQCAEIQDLVLSLGNPLPSDSSEDGLSNDTNSLSDIVSCQNFGNATSCPGLLDRY